METWIYDDAEEAQGDARNQGAGGTPATVPGVASPFLCSMVDAGASRISVRCLGAYENALLAANWVGPASSVDATRSAVLELVGWAARELTGAAQARNK